MKKLVFFLTFTVGAVFSNNVSAQAVEQGNVIFDGYYGFPNLYTTVFKTAYANSGTEVNLKINGIGPLGFRAEYMVADKMGVGIDVGFNNSKITYQEEGYDPNTNSTVMYDYTFSTQKLGVMATLNYHFLDNDKVDAYAAFGMGYGNRSFKFESTDPNYVEANISGLIPVASKISVGMRYFFTDNLGANLALGFGQGGIINAGLSFKL